LTYGNDPDAQAGEQPHSEGAGLSERVQLPDAGTVAAAAPAPREPVEDRHLRRGMDESRLGDQDSDPATGEVDRQVADQVNIQAARVEVSQASWSGPLPPPEILGQYERLLPGAAERILSMAETAATGQIDNQKKIAAAEIDASKRGLTFAMRLTMIMVGISAVFFMLGITRVGNVTASITAGSVFLSVPVIMLVRAFITRS
jgi:uncharacterized membrane protein